MPPFAVPSSLLSTSPVMFAASPNSFAWMMAFCPVVASSTSRFSRDAPGSSRSISGKSAAEQRNATADHAENRLPECPVAVRIMRRGASSQSAISAMRLDSWRDREEERIPPPRSSRKVSGRAARSSRRRGSRLPPCPCRTHSTPPGGRSSPPERCACRPECAASTRA